MRTGLESQECTYSLLVCRPNGRHSNCRIPESDSYRRKMKVGGMVWLPPNHRLESFAKQMTDKVLKFPLERVSTGRGACLFVPTMRLGRESRDGSSHRLYVPT